MNTIARRAVAAACLVAAVPAIARAAETTIRIEGSGATLLPETATRLADGPVALRDSFDADAVEVPAGSATAQLAGAAAAAGLPLGFQVFDFGGPASFITRIGPDAMPASFSPSWRLSVDHVAAQVGADTVRPPAGSRVVWAFVADSEARELDLSVSPDVVERGRDFEVAVRSYAVDGTATPATGASVVYAGVTRTADSAGRVTFTAQGSGRQAVTATRGAEVRSPARTVCSTAGDPSVCGLTAAAPAAAPSAAPAPVAVPVGTVAGAPPDVVAPGSRITFPVLGRAGAAPAAVLGTAGPDRSDVARVDVALARRVGTQCRFMGPRGGLGAVTACTSRRWLTARIAGGGFSLPLRRPLAPGAWRVWSRAVDGAGNVESTGIARLNTGTFRVTARTAAR